MPSNVPGDSTRRTPASARLSAFMVAACIVTAFGLRPAATSIGPVLSELTGALAISPAVAGVLTALPGFCFALVGLLAGRLNAAVGMTASLLIASLLGTLGLAVRAISTSPSFLIAFSAVALGGAAIGNVIVPAYIKQQFPNRSATMSTVYTTALGVGSAVPIFMSAAIFARVEERRPGAGIGAALGVWALLPAAALVFWTVLYLVDRGSRKCGTLRRRGLSAWQMFKSPTAVALMFFFGLQSMHAYIQFGWLPSAYRAGGVGAETASWMATLIALGGIPGGLIMPRVVERSRGLRGAIVSFGVALAAGYLGIAFAASWHPWVWALCLAFSGFCFPTALALIVERTKAPAVTIAVSGFVQPVGYLLAASGPLLTGQALALVGSWEPVLITLAASATLVVAAGLFAARPRLIDEELAH